MKKQVEVDSKLKEIPISLPDGTIVKAGMKVYTVEHLSASSDYDFKRYPEGRFLKYSGRIATELIEYHVLSVNQSAVSRSFTVKSDRGCEHTYSVKGQCLPDIYGSKAKATEKRRSKTLSDIAIIKTKIAKEQKEGMRLVRECTKRIAKMTKAITILKKAKYQ